MLLLTTVGYIIYQLITKEFTLGSLILLGAIILAIIPGMLTRIYALKLQDRLIRKEEQLRYYILTTKRLDPHITIAQIIALRFASDEEFVGLVNRTVTEKLTASEIKKAIQEWCPDNYRV